MALVNPHGKEKKLKPLLLSAAEIAEEKKRAKDFTVVPMSSRETADLIMMGIGGFTPLEGFMGHDDWKGSCSDQMTTQGWHLLAHPRDLVRQAGPGRFPQARPGSPPGG